MTQLTSQQRAFVTALLEADEPNIYEAARRAMIAGPPSRLRSMLTVPAIAERVDAELGQRRSASFAADFDGDGAIRRVLSAARAEPDLAALQVLVDLLLERGHPHGPLIQMLMRDPELRVLGLVEVRGTAVAAFAHRVAEVACPEGHGAAVLTLLPPVGQGGLVRLGERLVECSPLLAALEPLPDAARELLFAERFGLGLHQARGPAWVLARRDLALASETGVHLARVPAIRARPGILPPGVAARLAERHARGQVVPSDWLPLLRYQLDREYILPLLQQLGLLRAMVDRLLADAGTSTGDDRLGLVDVRDYPQAYERVGEWLADADPARRRQAIDVVAGWWVRRTAPDLAACALDEDGVPRAIAEGLADPSPLVRRTSLSRLAGGTSLDHRLPLLIAALEDEEIVRRAASIALQLLVRCHVERERVVETLRARGVEAPHLGPLIEAIITGDLRT